MLNEVVADVKESVNDTIQIKEELKAVEPIGQT